jgi:hypothetical protein
MLACNLPGDKQNSATATPYDLYQLYTQVALTQQAEQGSASATPTTSVDDKQNTATNTPVWQATATIKPTNTPPPTSTAVPIPQDWAGFVKDVTIYDDTVFTPGATFTKIWRLKNIGSRTWTKDYSLVFVGGENLNAEVILPLPHDVAPGHTIDVSVRMKAPDKPGTYTGLWQLRNNSGILFGIGEQASGAFWVQIKVVEPVESYLYDFATNYCAANWISSSAELPCPGIKGDSDGFAIFLNNPALENRNENEPTIWMHPGKGDEWITGIYPEFRIKKNYHFIGWIGCLKNADDCDVTFQLNYRINDGKVKKLGEWTEVNDGKVTKLDIDLSSLAGKDVQFILGVINNGKRADADAFWFIPHIRFVKPTPTPTITPTMTKTPKPTKTPTPTSTSTAPVYKEGTNEFIAYPNCFDLDEGIPHSMPDASCDFTVDTGPSGDGSDIAFTPENSAGFAFSQPFANQPSLQACQATAMESTPQDISPAGSYLCYQTTDGRFGYLYFVSYDALNGMIFNWRTYE